MTTKEEVLRLCETVGIKFTNCRTLKEPLFLSNGSQKFEVFTALIDLAKQAEREECITQIQLLQCPYKQPSDRHIWDMGVIDSIRAIRNREIKS